MIFMTLFFLNLSFKALASPALSDLQIEQNNHVKEELKNSSLVSDSIQQELKDSSLVSDSIQRELKDSSLVSDSIQQELKDSSLSFKSIVQLKNNQLKAVPYKWSVLNPWTKITWNQNFLKDHVFELAFEFSFKNNSWDYYLSELFFEHSFDFFSPLKLKWGYFEIPYNETNELLVSKTPLVEQQLFTYKREALGLSLEAQPISSLFFIFGLRSNDYQKASLDLKTVNQRAVWSAHVVYNKNKQSLFAGWFKEDRIGLGVTQSLGLGFDFNLTHKFVFLKLKNEVWHIKNKEFKNLVWYAYPYIRLFNRLGVGYFLGSLKQQTDHGLAQKTEAVFKINFYIKDFLHFSIENVKEYSTVYHENSWNFSLKTDFALSQKKEQGFLSLKPNF